MRKILTDVAFIGQDLTGTFVYEVKYVQIYWLSAKQIAKAINENLIYTAHVYGHDFMEACAINKIEILSTNAEV